MPMYYTVAPGAIQTTNATPNTANDSFFIAAGSGRTVWLCWVLAEGRGAGLTSISGISLRGEKFPTTASSGGTAITPSPNDKGFQAAKHTAGFATGAVTSGTGTAVLLCGLGFGSTSQGAWGNPSGSAANLDQAYPLESAATQSIDLFNVSGTASLNYEMRAGTAE